MCTHACVSNYNGRTRNNNIFFNDDNITHSIHLVCMCENGPPGGGPDGTCGNASICGTYASTLWYADDLALRAKHGFTQYQRQACVCIYACMLSCTAHACTHTHTSTAGSDWRVLRPHQHSQQAAGPGAGGCCRTAPWCTHAPIARLQVHCYNYTVRTQQSRHLTQRSGSPHYYCLPRLLAKLSVEAHGGHSRAQRHILQHHTAGVRILRCSPIPVR